MTDDAEDLYLVMQMYNLIEYNSNYSETTGSLWFYLKDEATNKLLQTVIILNLKVKFIRKDRSSIQIMLLEF